MTQIHLYNRHTERPLPSLILIAHQKCLFSGYCSRITQFSSNSTFTKENEFETLSVVTFCYMFEDVHLKRVVSQFYFTLKAETMLKPLFINAPPIRLHLSGFQTDQQRQHDILSSVLNAYETCTTCCRRALMH